MPKPRATTELWRRVRAIPRLSLMYGCGKLRPKRIPKVSAIGGENNPVNESARARTKTIFARVGIDWEKSIRPGAGWASKNENGRCEDSVRLPLLNPSEHHFSFSFGGGAAGSDFGGRGWARGGDGLAGGSLRAGAVRW